MLFLQMKLDELKAELEMWAPQERQNPDYVTAHANKGEFVQYMLRQCMRQNAYYNTKVREYYTELFSISVKLYCYKVLN